MRYGASDTKVAPGDAESPFLNKPTTLNNNIMENEAIYHQSYETLQAEEQGFLFMKQGLRPLLEHDIPSLHIYRGAILQVNR